MSSGGSAEPGRSTCRRGRRPHHGDSQEEQQEPPDPEPRIHPAESRGHRLLRGDGLPAGAHVRGEPAPRVPAALGPGPRRLGRGGRCRPGAAEPRRARARPAGAGGRRVAPLADALPSPPLPSRRPLPPAAQFLVPAKGYVAAGEGPPGGGGGPCSAELAAGGWAGWGAMAGPGRGVRPAGGGPARGGWGAESTLPRGPLVGPSWGERETDGARRVLPTSRAVAAGQPGIARGRAQGAGADCSNSCLPESWYPQPVSELFALTLAFFLKETRADT